MLSREQVERYRRDRFLSIPGFVKAEWLEPLHEVTQRFYEESRTVGRDDWRFDLEPDHSPDEPRIRRLVSPVDCHELYWSFASEGPIVDVEPGMGNVGFLPGSQEGELYDQYDGEDWVGCLSDADVATLDLSRAVYPCGPAGSITVHNCRTVHGSAPNESERERPLLLQTSLRRTPSPTPIWCAGLRTGTR